MPSYWPRNISEQHLALASLQTVQLVQQTTVSDIVPGVSFPPSVRPKKFKSRHVPTSTQSSANPIVSTGLVANVSEPQDQGGVEEGQVLEGAVDAPNPQDPDELAAIPEEELEGLEQVDDPDEESKVKPCKWLL